MKNFTIMVAAGVAVFATTYGSHSSPLSGSDIPALIEGKKVILSTSFGKMPLRYSANKTVIGDGSNTGLVKFFAPKERGKWWISKNQLCQSWPTWYDGKAYCFKITKTGTNRISWTRNDGYSGTARITR